MSFVGGSEEAGVMWAAVKAGTPLHWIPSWPERISLAVGCFSAAGLLWWWLHKSKFGTVPIFAQPLEEPQVVTIFGWERDRILSAGKGLATTSAGFLVTMVTMLLKDEIQVGISAITVLGLLLGTVGVLLVGGLLGASSRSLIENIRP